MYCGTYQDVLRSVVIQPLALYLYRTYIFLFFKVDDLNLLCFSFLVHISFLFGFVFAAWEIEARTSGTLGTCSTTELHYTRSFIFD
jgi:hypothetical protein